VQVVELRREFINKIAAGHGIFRIAAVDCVSSENWCIAKIFEPTATVWASSVDATNPRNTHTHAERQLGGCAVDNIPDNLVTRDKRLFSLRQFPVHDVEISTANAAGANPKEELTSGWLRFGNLFNLKWVFRGSEDGGFQCVCLAVVRTWCAL
jgi:hypothetical protein